MNQGNVVTDDVAEAEFERFVELMDLDVDPAGMDDEDKRSYAQAKRLITGAMRKGRVVVDEKGQPVFTPSSGDTSPITFHEPTGASLIAMDQKKKNHDMAKLYAAMADATKQPMARFTKMMNRDLRICTAIFSLFLG